MSTSPKLSYSGREFYLEGKSLRIFSGAIHYFRVIPEYWQDRLIKAKACGLNTVETYVPWNLHEPKPGTFKSSGILDLRRFIKLAGDLGLHVIFRPGPYICSEWDFGGLPSWLLADPDMEVRSKYKGYVNAVERYFGWLLPLISDLQHSHGGPIIAVQVENEFGSFSPDPGHMIFMRDLLLRNGIVELLVSCDNESAAGTGPIIDGVLPTANGQTVEEVKPNFEIIKQVNPAYPLMVMEFWTGWFDHWGRGHETRSVEVMRKTLEYIFQENASVNFYMFHGGTNFGFMSGALDLSSFKADTTSYDYDAPLSEEGILTEKALKMREMIQNEANDKNLDVNIPTSLPENPKRADKPIKVMVDEVMSWSEMIELCTKTTKTQDLDYMEMFVYANGDVQSYGYVIYRRNIAPEVAKTLTLTGPVRDRATVLLNGSIQGVFDRKGEEPSPSLIVAPQNSPNDDTLDIIVENLGRVNYTTPDKQEVLNSQRKGLRGPVRLGEDTLKDWKVMALDFNDDFLEQLSKASSWSKVNSNASGNKNVPALFRAYLELSEAPCADYFVSMNGWSKGLVIVNGFNLGRYWDIGPTKTLYLPAPILKQGLNQILVFEEAKAGASFTLDVEPCLGSQDLVAKI